MRSTKCLGFLVVLLAPYVALAAGECERYTGNQLARAFVKTESSGNPFAIGVVGGRLLRQPRNLQEAIATATALDAQGFDFIVGCRQVNQSNFGRYGLTLETAFDPKTNSETGSRLLSGCRQRARAKFGNSGAALRAALSSYYSGNFTTGQRKEGVQPSYADKVLANLATGPTGSAPLPIPVAALLTGASGHLHRFAP